MSDSKSSIYRQIIKNNNYIVRDHQVHNVSILPGVALLEMIYRISLIHLETQKITLKNILFHSPITTTGDFDSVILVKFEDKHNNFLITINSYKVDKQGNSLSENEDTNLTCTLFINNDNNENHLNTQNIITAATQEYDMDSIYQLALSSKIKHGPFMKVLGKVYQTPNEELMDIHLSDLSELSRENFYVHPALLDASTFAGTTFRLVQHENLSITEMAPYIPLAIEKFCIYRKFPQTVLVHSFKLPKPTDNNKIQDTVINTIHIYDTAGLLLAEFQSITYKWIRQAKLIENLASYRTENKITKNIESSIAPTLKIEKVTLIDDIIAFLSSEISQLTAQSGELISPTMGFYELGLSSFNLIELVNKIENQFQIELYPTLLFEYSNIESLANYLMDQYDLNKTDKQNQLATLNHDLICLIPDWVERKISDSVPLTSLRVISTIDSRLYQSLAQLIDNDCKLILLNVEAKTLPEQLFQIYQAVKNEIAILLPKKRAVLLQVVVDNEEAILVDFLAGLFKSLQKENHKFNSQIIKIEAIATIPAKKILDTLNQEFILHNDLEIFYRHFLSHRYIKKFRQAENIFFDKKYRYKTQGIYVIIGGVGRIGLVLLQHLINQHCAKILLMGRSDFNDRIKQLIASIENSKDQIVYIQCDVNDTDSLKNVIEEIQEKWGSINGIFHCAGVLDDKVLISNFNDHCEHILGPKIKGLYNLSTLLDTNALDFIVAFSSVSAILGKVGQTAYASANAFMDSFATIMGEKNKVNIISINWPYWLEGGMHIDADEVRQIYAKTGMNALPNSVALEALDSIIENKISNVAVLYGDENKILTTLDSLIFNPTIEVIVQSPKFNPQNQNRDTDIAIIGISGRYPQADTLSEFYQNLKIGKDCISNIPLKRWENYPLSYDLTQYYQHGGFLNNIEYFDPLFFNLSPKQAATMDPQARLFLEAAWHACEDAGFVPTKGETNNLYFDQQKVGVFVGVFWSHYELFSAEMTKDGTPICFGNTPSIIPNLVSYCLNFHGPSLAVDTMCSSSLTAIHLACNSIRQGESHFAIAGGVNLITHPHRYLFLKEANFLSSNGHCRSFAAKGDGYVPGEGVGAILLTRLDFAEQNGFPIYAIIRGSAVNHGGKTSGMSVPDPHAQCGTILNALKNANVEARTISYIEAHGTGTHLGDPIEIQGLDKAFKQSTSDQQFCALGSSKSNIGHCEAAAGIAGLTKVLLQFKHKELFPTLYCEQQNPLINFNETPFYLQRTCSEWKPYRDYPRRAGLSSFGAGGSNAHLILEEYIAAHDYLPLLKPTTVIIPISAKTKTQLKLSLKSLADFLERETVDLSALSYTLQVGRLAMQTRLAFIINSQSELIKHLTNILNNRLEKSEPYYIGEVNHSLKKSLSEILFTANPDKDKLIQIAEGWVNGAEIDWNKLYGKKPNKISLPTYPFAKERYWFDSSKVTARQKEINQDIQLYQEVWRVKQSNVSAPDTAHSWVYFSMTEEDCQQFRTAIQQQNKKNIFIDVRLGTETIQTGPCNFTITDTEEGHTQWINHLNKISSKNNVLVYSWVKAKKLAGIKSIIQFIQMIEKNSLNINKLILIGHRDTDEESCWDETWIALSRSIQAIKPKLKIKLIYTNENVLNPATIINEAKNPHIVYFNNGQRYQLQVEPIAISTLSNLPSILRNECHYLIVGGCGGIGQYLSQYLAKNYRAHLTIIGRRAQKDVQSILDDIMKAGTSSLRYFQVDIGHYDELKKFYGDSQMSGLPYNGIIHAAGQVSLLSVFDKSIESIEENFLCKIQGSINLDRISKHSNIDFLCYFSSTSALLGDFGIVDYAMGNRFQMAYGQHRETLTKAKERRGKTITISWPLWQDGGMDFANKEQSYFYLKSSGQVALPGEEGLTLWENLIASPLINPIVVKGDIERIKQILSKIYLEDEGIHLTTNDKLKPLVIATIEKYIKSILQIGPAVQLSINEALVDFGFDSITLSELANVLSNSFAIEIIPTLFFNYSTINSIADFLIKNEREKIATKYTPLTCLKDSSILVTKNENQESHNNDIAIIGMAGRFPQANNIEQLWQLISHKKTACTEVPADRWRWQDYYFSENDSNNSITTNKGCFIDNVYDFDPLFFEISPKEANAIDPRQRLLLQESWHALEDAGYPMKKVRGKNYGVFIGVEEGEYDYLTPNDKNSIISHHNGILAGRISYFLDLKGPNLAINTACSSGLVALHQAVQSLRQNECELALVGSANTLLSVNSYQELTKLGILSSNQCHPFDVKANGILPGESAIILVLKPLIEALSDEDKIYGVIKSSAVNYDGKTNGITAPNGISQFNLINNLYNKCDINVENIEYFIAHGTGTKLGDPIEVNALTDVFKHHTQKLNYCAISSIKANIGHTFAASGLVNIACILMALKHNQIPPMLNCTEVSDHINFSNSPFYINQQLRAWEAKPSKLRLAATSAFGMSGTNAHVVIEEYKKINLKKLPNSPSCYLLPVSAKTEAQLKAYLSSLLNYIKETNPLLIDLAYTYQTGREAMEERATFLVKDSHELIEKLHLYLENGAESHDPVNKIEFAISPLCTEEELQQLADAWMSGIDVNWSLLYSEVKPLKISTPTYPFLEQSFRLQASNVLTPSSSQNAVKYEKDLLHKILHKLKILLNELTDIGIDKININTPLVSYGIDSLMIVQLNEKFNSLLPNLSKTILYEVKNLNELANYIFKNNSEECLAWLDLKSTISSEIKFNQSTLQSINHIEKTFSIAKTDKKNSIAIISVSGNYPEAPSIEQLWKNLVLAKNCVTEIPKIRWNLADHYHPNAEEAFSLGKSYSKWGGFIANFSEFDPLFFNISPHDALSMDPQERVFLQCCWDLLERAGHTRSALTQHYNKQVGVFVGVTKNYFQSVSPNYQEGIVPTSLFWSIANRLSYFLDIEGPSLAIDTACSSSLSSVHTACLYLLSGECQLAIAGGVNLNLHPASYNFLSATRAISSNGYCESFGKGANGYVPSEGVGSILLKPLDRAIADNDTIHGVILASRVNHGGKTHGFTVPNPNAHSKLIIQTIRDANINPRAISYIEAHGTGTSLGDPIEIAGLTQAFNQFSHDTQYCAIGSIKSNIGHCEAAAGIAGITKVLLQMKAKQIVPSLHADILNPNINFESTPFKVQQNLVEWNRPIINENGQSIEYPRISGISSFGAGGANAHLILQEYESPPDKITPSYFENQTFLFPISAKAKEQLIIYAKNIASFLQESSINFIDLVYTFQIGREAMDYRTIFIIKTTEELLEKLNQFILGETHISDCFQSNIQSDETLINSFADDEDVSLMIDHWVIKEKWDKIALLWVKGIPINWDNFYPGLKPKIIVAPTYPFKKENYWIGLAELPVENNSLNNNTIEIQRQIKMEVSQILNVLESDISETKELINYGLDSIANFQLLTNLRKVFNISLPPSILMGDVSIESITHNIKILKQENSPTFNEGKSSHQFIDVSSTTAELIKTHFNLKVTSIILGKDSSPFEILCYGDSAKPTILMIPGLGCNSITLLPLMQLLSQFHLIAYHPPGIGETILDIKNNIKSQIKQHLRMLQQTFLKNKKMTILGASLGGLIAQSYAHENAEDVESLILIATSTGGSHVKEPSQPVNSYLMQNMWKNDMEVTFNKNKKRFNVSKRQALSKLMSLGLTLPPANALYYLDFMQSLQFDATSTINCPILILNAEEDLLQGNVASNLLTTYPFATHETIAGSGHFLSITHAKECNRLIQPFLK